MTDPTHLIADDLIDAACSATTLNDFGADGWQTGLGLVCEGLNANRVRSSARGRLGTEITSHLENRLRVVDWHRQHPELASEPVSSPVIILGLPRTGTTAVSYVLDQDPQFRSLLNWEAVYSAPPAAASDRRSDQRCVELLEFQRAVVDHIDPPPPHWEWADGPTECTFLLAQDFKTVMWDSRAPSPAYHEYLNECDMESAYAYHRSVLQVLQSNTSGRWCLKMPAHALFIDDVLRAYPDARFIWTHRDPVAATASFLNLTAFAHGLTIGAPDIEWITSTCLPRLAQQVERPMRALAGHDVCHVFYDDWLADPMAAITTIYEWLEMDLVGSARDAMVGWLGDDPLAVSRGSKSTVEDFGLQRDQVYERFGDYMNRFDLEPRVR